MRYATWLPLFLLLVGHAEFPGAARADDPPRVAEFLESGRLAEGEKALTAALAANPKDDQLRFGLGVLQFVRAVEARVQGFHQHGLRSDVGRGLAPITNLPIPANPNPKPLDAQGLRAMFQSWVDDLAKAEATLAGVTSADVELPLRFGLIRLDLDGDGKVSEEESLWKVYTRFNRNVGQISAQDAAGFVIAFDRGDVDWLRGYCHFLMAVGDVILAHDFDELFRETGYLFFAGAKVPQPFLVEKRGGENFDMGSILDLVATIHLMRLEVREPRRMASALGHLESMVSLSRSSWKAILAETDDDHEWVPNPRQASVLPGGAVTDEIVRGWHDALDEFGAVLGGKRLVPFWRGNGTKGINLRRVFLEPRTFDLVLWVRGTAAAPYLEEGPISGPATWGRINRVFRGEFLGFAMWFN